jgi:hypothetical protein
LLFENGDAMRLSKIGRIRPQYRFITAFFVFLLAISASGEYIAANKGEPLVIVMNDRYGYIDHDGKMLIHPQFIWGDDFRAGLGTVYICGRYLSINSSGDLLPLRPAVPGQLEPQKEGDKFGFVDSSGVFKIAPSFDAALPFSGGFAAVRIGLKWGFVNKKGRLVIPPRFKAAFYFDEGVGFAEMDSGKVFIDTSGKVIAEGYSWVLPIAFGRIPVCRNRMCGYLDLRGKIAIPFTYQEVRNFSDGLAAVEKEGKWGYVNRDGRLVIPIKFDQAGPFANGLAPAIIGQTSGFIDKSGMFSFYLSFQYSPGFLRRDVEMGTALSDVARFFTDDDKFGYVNKSGRVIWGPIPNGSPDHAPITGWSEKDKIKSCEGVSDEMRGRIAKFPK